MKHKTRIAINERKKEIIESLTSSSNAGTVGVEQLDKLKEAAMPLIKYLSENFHPHVTAIVTPTSIELQSKYNITEQSK